MGVYNKGKKYFSGFLKSVYGFVKNEKPLDTLAGLFVIFVALFFLSWSLSKADLKKVKGYNIIATFSQTGGLNNGADVIINGVKVGSVKSIEINKTTFSVIIKMSIENDIKLPQDSIAEITTSGLMGSKYIKVNIGKSKEILKENDSIKTTNYASLEEIIGQILFSSKESKDSDDETIEEEKTTGEE